MTAIFVVCTGQDDNIGDVVLRRQLLGLLHPHGTLHVLIGGLSETFQAGLGLRSDDVVYTSMEAWKRAAFRSAMRGRTWYVDKPGEVQPGWRHLRPRLGLLPLQLVVKARRGLVLHLGLGQRRSDPGPARVLRLLLRLSDMVAWRDVSSHAAFRIGAVMPDLGFGETPPGAESADRKRLVVSYRSDRPELSDRALQGFADAAGQLDLTLTVVTQVRRDSSRSQSLAGRLSAELIDWPESRDHAEQENLLRRIYADAALVVSDRLHVLIVAMTEGAVPVCVVEHPEGKISRHFEAIGFADSVFDVASQSPSAVSSVLTRALGRSGEASAALRSAHAELHHVAEQVDALAAKSAGR